MLRINLLPGYVTQRRRTKQLIPVFVILFAVCVAGPLAWYLTLHQALVTLTQQASDAVTGKTATDALKTQATTTLGQIGPITTKLQFFKDVAAYPAKYIERYSTLADTTPKSSFIYTGAAISGTTMTIKAYSPSVEEVGRYLQVMYHEPDFSTVAVDKIPAYPDNIRHLYYLNGTLVFADGTTGSGASSAGAPPPGSYGGGNGPGGQTTNAAPANWNPDALGPNGPTNLPPGVGPPPPQIAVGTAGAGGPQGGMGGGQMAGSGTYSANFLRIAGQGISPFASPAIRDRILQNALRRVVVKTVPKGFDINVTATLKQALSPPVPPGGAPAGGGFPGAPGSTG